MSLVRPHWLAIALLVASQALPASADFTPRVRAACAADAKRLCPKDKLGSSEMRYCMEAKGRSLSSGCVRVLEDEGTIPRGHFRR